MFRRSRTLRGRKKSKQELLKVFFAGGALIVALVVLWIANLDIPNVNSFDEREVVESTKVYDRTGEVLLFDFHDDVRRTIIPAEDISRHIKNATVAIEDSEFYEHEGIQIGAIFRAALVNVLSLGFEQGGSTITQQVVKNSLLTQEKTITRKIKEWIIAVKLEKQQTKEGILTLYLNEAPYGGNVYGVAEASRSFFGKTASELTLAEAAYLAALPQAPSYYSPYGENVEKLENRKNLVLRRMQELGFITQKEYEEALQEEVEFQPREDSSIKAPHFVFFVREYIKDKYGEGALRRGLEIVTTLDYELQKEAEEIVERRALENEDLYNAENAGLVAIDPKTGQVLVMVGSRGYFDENIDGNFNITTSFRQPGSAFKPFVYAAAFMKGYTPNTVVFDLKTQFSTTCSPTNFTSVGNCYSPTNYDGVFRGPMTLRDALAQSVNIPSVKTLYLAGLDDSLRVARNLGIGSLVDVGRYGLTLVLGGGEVSLLDMTSAYSVFANNGERNSYTPILEVQTGDGEILEKFEAQKQQVIPEHIAQEISDVLSDNEARAPAFGVDSFLNIPTHDVAVKTGTTNDYRDAWIIGYNPNLAVGAWAGNNDNSPMEKRVAGFIIAPLWRDFMNVALSHFPNEPLNDPPLREVDKPVLDGEWKGSEFFVIDTISGGLATEFTPKETQKRVVFEDIHSILHWVNRNNPQGPIPQNPARDPQYRLWEYPVQLWKNSRGIVEDNSDINIPDYKDNVHTKKSVLDILINGLEDSYTTNEPINLSFSSDGKYDLKQVDIYLNNRFIDSITKPPFQYTINPRLYGDVFSNENILRVVGTDEVFNKDEEIEDFKVE